MVLLLAPHNARKEKKKRFSLEVWTKKPGNRLGNAMPVTRLKPLTGIPALDTVQSNLPAPYSFFYSNSMSEKRLPARQATFIKIPEEHVISLFPSAQSVSSTFLALAPSLLALVLVPALPGLVPSALISSPKL